MISNKLHCSGPSGELYLLQQLCYFISPAKEPGLHKVKSTQMHKLIKSWAAHTRASVCTQCQTKKAKLEELLNTIKVISYDVEHGMETSSENLYSRWVQIIEDLKLLGKKKCIGRLLL